MNIEQERTDFEAWWAARKPAASIKDDAFAAYQAGRAALQSQDREDAERLDWLREETCDLRCINVPTGGDDYDVRWVVIQHHMSKPHEREIGRSFTEEPRDAIDHARRIEGDGE